MKSYDVTIQMKALCLYFHMMLFVCQNFRNEIWEFARNLPLATFGSERVNGATLRQGFNSYLPMAAGN